MSKLIRGARQASLGSLYNGLPLVSMVLIAPSPDLSSYYIHISRLAQHTRDIDNDPSIGLMMMEPDQGAGDPQQLSRVSLLGRAFKISGGDSDYQQACSLYLERYPTTAPYFTFSDFRMYRIKIESGRFVAGLAKAINLTAEDLKQASQA
ncbi:MAG: pyridoxamine 5'-phosphate oxidase family protein [Anaerolineales bacterium]|nr:pyridoxamine 5'-phosphate oxidase family protein [Anaerolineales bacterium]